MSIQESADVVAQKSCKSSMYSPEGAIVENVRIALAGEFPFVLVQNFEVQSVSPEIVTANRETKLLISERGRKQTPLDLKRFQAKATRFLAIRARHGLHHIIAIGKLKLYRGEV